MYDVGTILFDHIDQRTYRVVRVATDYTLPQGSPRYILLENLDGDLDCSFTVISKMDYEKYTTPRLTVKEKK